MPWPPTNADNAAIDLIVEAYEAERESATQLETGLKSLVSIKKLAPFLHSVKSRTKDPEHLRDKLLRRLEKRTKAGLEFDVTPTNLFEKINDLAGIRLLHLHTTQFKAIDEILREAIDEERYKILEGPEARVWDDEYRQYFESINVPCVKVERDLTKPVRMYTSVHYVVQPGKRTMRTAEIQVRTLAEELWGEVDHAINYPHDCGDVACSEQLKVLARVTSSSNRLVDSIFTSMEEAKKRRVQPGSAAPPNGTPPGQPPTPPSGTHPVLPPTPPQIAMPTATGVATPAPVPTPAPPPVVKPARYVIRKVGAQYLWTLTASNGEEILTSEMYGTRHGAENGIASCKVNSAMDARYEHRTTANGMTYFTLKAPNGEIIGTSEPYVSTSARDHGIALCKASGPAASVEDGPT